MSLNAAERETVMTISDDEKVWAIYSAQRPVITALKKNPAFQIEEEGTFEGSAFIRGTLPMNGITIRKSAGRNGKKREATHLRKNTCAHVKEGGERCGMVAKKGSEFCRWHEN